MKYLVKNFQFPQFSCTSKSATLWGHDLSEFLTTTDQIIPSKAVINGNLIVKNDAEIKHLKTSGNVCEHNLSEMIKDTVLVNEKSVNIIGETLFSGNVTFDRIVVKGNLFGLGNFYELLERIQHVEDTVELNGSFQFLKKVDIRNLLFSKDINKVTGMDFGKQWLVKGADQVNVCLRYI